MSETWKVAGGEEMRLLLNPFFENKPTKLLKIVIVMVMMRRCTVSIEQSLIWEQANQVVEKHVCYRENLGFARLQLEKHVLRSCQDFSSQHKIWYEKAGGDNFIFFLIFLHYFLLWQWDQNMTQYIDDNGNKRFWWWQRWWWCCCCCFWWWWLTLLSPGYSQSNPPDRLPHEQVQVS